jgi:hypothetical protein
VVRADAARGRGRSGKARVAAPPYPFPPHDERDGPGVKIGVERGGKRNKEKKKGFSDAVGLCDLRVARVRASKQSPLAQAPAGAQHAPSPPREKKKKKKKKEMASSSGSVS